jgi:hypothetical protein
VEVAAGQHLTADRRELVRARQLGDRGLAEHPVRDDEVVDALLRLGPGGQVAHRERPAVPVARPHDLGARPQHGLQPGVVRVGGQVGLHLLAARPFRVVARHGKSENAYVSRGLCVDRPG